MQKKRVFGYVRVSTREQAMEGVSLAAQEEKLRGYASLYDMEIVHVFVDAGLSAKSVEGRPGLVELLARMEAGEADGILIAKLDRLSRSLEDMCALTRRYFREEFSLVSVSDQINTDTASGRMVLNMLMTIAEWERDIIGERTVEALSHLQREGVKLGGTKFGERRGDMEPSSGRLAVLEDHVELACLGRMQELREDGMSLRAVAAALDMEGFPPKRGGKWAASSVSKILGRCA